jgi:hypothetical protein
LENYFMIIIVLQGRRRKIEGGGKNKSKD